ncbi:putative GAG protein [Labeo rohita]|uniref:Putative GAG protein n=1 Tax=Labeo rohita TaxID=84645 RepID=A0A498NXA6_LABRO|nr:putative GAG protein [Labeo rohita]
MRHYWTDPLDFKHGLTGLEVKDMVTLGMGDPPAVEPSIARHLNPAQGGLLAPPKPVLPSKMDRFSASVYQAAYKSSAVAVRALNVSSLLSAYQAENLHDLGQQLDKGSPSPTLWKEIRKLYGLSTCPGALVQKTEALPWKGWPPSTTRVFSGCCVLSPHVQGSATDQERDVYDGKVLGPPPGPRKQLFPVVPACAKHMRHYWTDPLDFKHGLTGLEVKDMVTLGMGDPPAVEPSIARHLNPAQGGLLAPPKPVLPSKMDRFSASVYQAAYKSSAVAVRALNVSSLLSAYQAENLHDLGQQLDKGSPSPTLWKEIRKLYGLSTCPGALVQKTEALPWKGWPPSTTRVFSGCCVLSPHVQGERTGHKAFSLLSSEEENGGG